MESYTSHPWPPILAWPDNQKRYRISKTVKGSFGLNRDVLAIEATPGYSNHLHTCMRILYGNRKKIERTLDAMHDDDALPVIPLIRSVELHPGFDVLKMSGPMGTHPLITYTSGVMRVLQTRLLTDTAVPLPERTAEERFPRMLEDFDDDDVDLFLSERFRCLPGEIREIRALQQKLRMRNPGYRKFL